MNVSEQDGTGSKTRTLEERMRAHPAAFAVVVSGPSGVGKSSICSRVLERTPDVKTCVTTTTRSKRSGEQDEVHYHFITRPEFQAKAGRNEFVEWVEVYGDLYGATVEAVEKALQEAGAMLLDVDVQGAATWKQSLGQRCVTVFVLPPSLDTLADRLNGRRTEAPAALQRRRENAAAEMKRAKDYDYLMVNHDVEQAALDLEAIIRAERHKPWRMMEALGQLEF